MIGVTLGSDTVMAGHFLTAEVQWSSDASHPARRILVSAAWETSAFNGTRRGVARSIAHVAGRGENQGRFPVRLLIPHEGPVSFKGEVLTIEWKLWARIDRPGIDEVADVGFRVIPLRAT
jgi:hypothetical protein